jgi:hypothetical protein
MIWIVGMRERVYTIWYTMTRLYIDLPEEVMEKLEEKAARSGYASLEEYAQAILIDETEEYGSRHVSRQLGSAPRNLP